MLIISRSMDLWKQRIFLLYVHVINCRFHLFQSSASIFSSEYLLLYLKSSSAILLFSTPFIYIICPSMASWRRQFLLRIWPIFCMQDIRSALFFPICLRTSLLVTFSDHFIFSILFQYHILKLSKYLPSNFLDRKSVV